MAGITKFAPINGGNLIPDIGTNFSILRTKRTVAIVYAFVFVFIALSILLAFTPSSSTSSPWFTNIFTTNGVSTTSTASSSSPIFSDESYRSHFSSIYYYFFPNSTSQSHNSLPSDNSGAHNTMLLPPNSSNQASDLGNQTSTEVVLQNNSTGLPSVNNGSSIATPPTPSPDLKANQSTIAVANSTDTVNNTASSSSSPTVVENVAENGEKENQNRSEDHKIEASKANQSTIAVTKSTDTVNNTMSSSSLPTVVENVAANGEKENLTRNKDKIEDLKANQSTIVVTKSTDTVNNTVRSSTSPTGVKNVDKGIAEKGVFNNSTSSLMKKRDDGKVKQGINAMIKSLMNCDLFDGNWVKDDSYPLYKPDSCSLIDEQFNCFRNGRPDNGYLKLKWKPRGCTLPRLDGNHLLEMLREKRLVFVGDSLNRNMWESLICILKNSVKDQKKVYEEFGRHHFRTEASYSFVFEDFKCTVEFFVAPFLVQEWETKTKNGKTKETLRLDMVSRSANKYKSADIIVFNTGHWWTHEKTSTGKDYYQEGSHVYSELNVLEAFRKALTTWGMWIDANVNPAKSLVFFRGYSASHFSGGQWNSGGQCDHETEPIKNETYLTEYPPKMTALERVFKGMKTHVTYLNVTRLTDYRKDGHPSIYRKQHMSDEERRSPLKFQDCSHWCLPGVPDAWNELLYAELLVKLNQKRL